MFFFYKKMTSRAVHYDVIKHPFPIYSQYLKTWGLTALPADVNQLCWRNTALFVYFVPTHNLLANWYVHKHFWHTFISQ